MTEADPTTKPKREKDETGREILVYDNGLIKEASTGHIIKPPNNGITSSERGRELTNIRHEKVRAKTRSEILRLTKAANLPDMPPIENADDAYSLGVALTWAASVLNPEAYPRDKIDALEVIGKIADFLPREKQQVTLPTDGLNIFANISADALLQIAERVEENARNRESENE
jgi:hypothetical protein